MVWFLYKCNECLVELTKDNYPGNRGFCYDCLWNLEKIDLTPDKRFSKEHPKIEPKTTQRTQEGP